MKGRDGMCAIVLACFKSLPLLTRLSMCARSITCRGRVRARTGEEQRREEVCVGVCVSNRQGEIER